MSSRYAKEYTIPEGFPELLKDFAREVCILTLLPHSLFWLSAVVVSTASNSKMQNNWTERGRQCICGCVWYSVSSNLPAQVLRGQPKNIYEFGAEYFARKVKERDGMLRFPTSC